MFLIILFSWDEKVLKKHVTKDYIKLVKILCKFRIRIWHVRRCIEKKIDVNLAFLFFQAWSKAFKVILNKKMLKEDKKRKDTVICKVN